MNSRFHYVDSCDKAPLSKLFASVTGRLFSLPSMMRNRLLKEHQDGLR